MKGEGSSDTIGPVSHGADVQQRQDGRGARERAHRLHGARGHVEAHGTRAPLPFARIILLTFANSLSLARAQASLAERALQQGQPSAEEDEVAEAADAAERTDDASSSPADVSVHVSGAGEETTPGAPTTAGSGPPGEKKPRKPLTQQERMHRRWGRVTHHMEGLERDLDALKPSFRALDDKLALAMRAMELEAASTKEKAQQQLRAMERQDARLRDATTRTAAILERQIKMNQCFGGDSTFMDRRICVIIMLLCSVIFNIVAAVSLTSSSSS